MDYKTFKQAWDASGLPEYYQMMDDLQSLGFSFSEGGDMDFHESEALAEWMGDERSIKDVTLAECEAILPEIRKRAEILRQNDKTQQLPDSGTQDS